LAAMFDGVSACGYNDLVAGEEKGPGRVPIGKCSSPVWSVLEPPTVRPCGCPARYPDPFRITNPGAFREPDPPGARPDREAQHRVVAAPSRLRRECRAEPERFLSQPSGRSGQD